MNKYISLYQKNDCFFFLIFSFYVFSSVFYISIYIGIFYGKSEMRGDEGNFEYLAFHTQYSIQRSICYMGVLFLFLFFKATKTHETDGKNERKSIIVTSIFNILLLVNLHIYISRCVFSFLCVC